MALLAFFISTVFAVMALRGWPLNAEVWLRGLIALVFFISGTAALLFSRSSRLPKRLNSIRQRRLLDGVVGGLLIIIVLGLIYLILIFAPRSTREFSLYLMATTKAHFAPLEQVSEVPVYDYKRSSLGRQYKIGSLYEPNGAIIPKFANLSPAARPVVSLKMTDRKKCDQLCENGDIYLHLFSHHIFDGDRWTSPNLSTDVVIESGADGRIQLDTFGPPPEHDYTILYHEFSNGPDALATLQGVKYVCLPQLIKLNEGTWMHPRPNHDLGIIHPYQAASAPRNFSDLIARGEQIEPGYVDSSYLASSSSESLNKLVKELAMTFKRDAPLQDQLTDLQAWMTDNFSYSMQLDYPDKKKSAVESFLEDPKTSKGFCVHYASAAALVLREMGIPSRVSYGWYGGEYYPEYHQFVFRAQDGHAWAEIFLQDQGWVVFETTPASGLPVFTSQTSGLAPPDPATAIEEVNIVEEGLTHRPTSGPKWIWLGLVSVAVIAISLLTMHRLRRMGLSPKGRHDQVARPAHYLQIFFDTCAGFGHPKAAGDTLSQYLDSLALNGVTIPFAGELLCYHYDVTYRDAPRDMAREKRLCRLIKAL